MPDQIQIVLQEPGRLEAASGSVPEMANGSALVRVRAIGVCGTDIHAFNGRQPFFEYPRILGHELGGEILEIDGGSGDAKAGDLCAVEPYLNDAESQASRRGRSNCCENLQVLGVHCDGGMRPVIRVPADKVHVSAKLDCERLALVEMLGIGAHAVARSGLEDRAHGGRVAVVGTGPIGLSVIQFLEAAGVDSIAVVDVDARRLAFCREAFGIEHTIEAGEDCDVAGELRRAGGGDLPSVIFDATGHPGSMMSNFERVAHGGTIVFVGLFQGEVSFDDPNFHRREITLMSSRNATPSDWRRVIAAVESGDVDTAPWITHRLGLGEVPGAFGAMIADPELRKALIEVDD